MYFTAIFYHFLIDITRSVFVLFPKQKSYTSSCIVEAMHVHASDRKLTEAGSAKFFVKGNGDTTVENKEFYPTKRLERYESLSKETIWKCI